MTNHDESTGSSGDRNIGDKNISAVGGRGWNPGRDRSGGDDDRIGRSGPDGRGGEGRDGLDARSGEGRLDGRSADGRDAPAGRTGREGGVRPVPPTVPEVHGGAVVPGGLCHGGGADRARDDHHAGGVSLPGGEHQVTLRTPAELADALPYLLGYRPDDSIVLVALHDRERRGRFGGRARLGIPAHEEDWPSASDQLAQGLVKGSERRGARPESMVAYLCQEPGSGESGRDVMERLRPLAQLLRTACGRLDVPVIEALCISDGRFWTYTCPGRGCCPAEGTPMGLPGTSVLAAAATYAGLQVRGSLKDLTARFLPWESTAALGQEVALDTASMALVPRILADDSRAEVAEETLALAGRIKDRFAAAFPVSGTRPADLRDDGLLENDEAATLILGLQDRTTRDRAAQWMEGDEAAPALRLWRALARRCVGPYREHAAAPLTLAGWVAWSMGDELEAREALAMALGADPDYLFARLLHQACNEGLDPESVRRCLRAERTDGDPADAERPVGSGTPLPAAGPATPGSPAPGTPPPTSAARRRRLRPTGTGGSRPGRRGSGPSNTQGRRPAGGASPAGSRPRRSADRAEVRQRGRVDSARHGAGEDA
ncbi:DUF4192 family protein [Streptomyces sp. NPDC058751]|uniref:DUF4192 domain-containing protein n=1 Tax=Streptomyces sp. NPDC058751 TaxID=3346623 RepID=UPI0036A4AE7A